jgi:hypothetical protein
MAHFLWIEVGIWLGAGLEVKGSKVDEDSNERGSSHFATL